MQVRTIEFQENFARQPVEGARQQSIMQRGPELIRQQVAQVAASEHAIDLSRPTAAGQMEGRGIVNAEMHRAPERRETLSNRRTRKQGERRSGTDGVSGTRIDLVA